MPFKRVTCPETAHLEVLELDYHPLGILISRCSRFLPGCELACTRRCAALLDRRLRSQCGPEEARALREGCERPAPRDTLETWETRELREATMSSTRPRRPPRSVGDQTRYDLDLDTLLAQRRES
jgi:hypothetical protein